MKRKMMCLFLGLMMLLAVGSNAYAVSKGALNAADSLHKLGLFNGIGTDTDGTPNYALDRALTRQEAVIMLVRLLGKEAEAQNGTWETPFTDVAAWAAPYVGYAYSEGLTNGITTTTFGGEQPVSAAQYITFVLRALGYSSETDFTWNTAWEKSDALGITDGSYHAANNEAFLRGDVAVISFSALTAQQKSGDSTLAETLMDEGAISEETADALGLFQTDKYTAFARKLLIEGGSEHIIPISNGMIAAHQLQALVGNYDVYLCTGLMPNPTDPKMEEKLLALALQQYAAECVDGDYADDFGANSNVYVSSFSCGGFLLTDGKGSVVGYALHSEAAPSQITVITCRKDSRSLVNSTTNDLSSIFTALTVVPCEMKQENGRFIYTFSNVPDGTVWMDSCAYGGSESSSKIDINVEKYVGAYLSGLQAGQYGGFALQNPYNEVSFYAVGQHGGCYKVFVFMDADHKLLGYSVAELHA